MKYFFSVTKTPIAIIALLLVFIFSNTGLAQNKPASKAASDAPPQPMGITVIKVKPGMDLDWENFLKKDLVPMLKKGGFKQMSVSKTNMFGEDSTYIFVWPVENMAQFDGPDPIAAAMGPDGLAVVLSNMQRTVANSRTFLLNPMPDLNIPPKQGYEIKMGVMATISVAPGRKDEYIKNSKELIAAVGKTNAKAVLTGNVGLGGNPNEFIIFVAFDSFADLGQFPQSMGKVMETTKLTPETGVTTHVEYMVVKMAPELGIQPAGQ